MEIPDHIPGTAGLLETVEATFWTDRDHPASVADGLAEFHRRVIDAFRELHEFRKV